MTEDTRDDNPPSGQAVPPSLTELGVFSVATMRADVLDAFASRIRRAWPAADLAPLECAVAARRRARAEPEAERGGA